MIFFEEINIRLKTLGKDRAWLAEQTAYSPAYLRDVIAPSSAKRTARVQKIISDAIEREESAQAAAKESAAVEALKQHAITVYPSREQFNRWTEAFKASQARNLEEWADRGLNDRAYEWERRRRCLNLI